MKIVINKCYGGFSLSVAAEQLYAKKSGFELFYYKHEKDKWVKLTNPDDTVSVHTFTKDYGDSFEKYDSKDYWSSRKIERTDPILVEVVEELSEDANGAHASLSVIEIPDDIKYEIDEYDGIEHVAEAHRVWS